MVAASSRSVGRPRIRPAARQQRVGEHVERPSLVRAEDGAPLSQHDRGAVVHRGLEQRGRDDQTVEQRDRDARRSAARQCPEQPAAGRAVQQQPVVVPGIAAGHDIRLAIDRDADVRDQAGVEDRGKHGPVVTPLFLAVAGPWSGACLWGSPCLQVRPGLGEDTSQDLLDLVELGLVADQRWRDLDHRVAAVVGPADQAGLEQRRRTGSRAAAARSRRRRRSPWWPCP